MAVTFCVVDNSGRRYTPSDVDSTSLPQDEDSGSDAGKSIQDHQDSDEELEETFGSEEEEMVTTRPKSNNKKGNTSSQAKAPTKARKPTASVTKKVSSGSTNRSTTAKSSSGTSGSRRPTAEVSVHRPKDISPISEELNNSKNQRRSDSLNSMSTSSSSTKENKEERSKRKHQELLQDKEAELENLKKLLEEAKAQQAPVEIEVPKPKSRGSTKKKRSKSTQKSTRGVSLDGFVKNKAKDQFRHTKFVTNDDVFRKRVGDKVMDELEIAELHHKEGETDNEALIVDRYRDKFYQEWCGVMATGFNEARNYRQGRVKDVCIQWMVDNTTAELFPTEDLIFVMKRDFSEFEPRFDEDGTETAPGDPERLAYYHRLFDWYVDKLVPAMAGSRDFNESVRHFVPLSEAKYGPGTEELAGKVMVTPGMEALILVFFENARKKWEMMYDWDHVKGYTNKKTHPYPKWSPKEPEKNREWRTLYSNPSSGQDPFGGWKLSGIMANNKYLTMMNEVREDMDLCLYTEKLAVQRLYETYKELHEKPGKAQNAKDPAEDIASFQMIFEDDDI